jgi:hypothetical protein
MSLYEDEKDYQNKIQLEELLLPLEEFCLMSLQLGNDASTGHANRHIIQYYTKKIT